MALSWPAPLGPLMPPAWWQTLRSSTKLDIALRLTLGSDPKVLLLLTANHAETLKEIYNTLITTTMVAGLKQPDSALEFDVLTSVQVPYEHLRVHHEGYHHENQILGCDFRLYSTWLGQRLPEGVAYQVVFRSHQPGLELERRVRKYLAWLELEQPFTPSVREMQQILSRRILSPGWLTDEYLLFSNTSLREAWQERICLHFSETTGRIGFLEAPLESGDFSDLITIGCHSMRDSEVPSALPVQAAATFSDDEVAWLTRQYLAFNTSNTVNLAPDIFISYASGDFPFADATRQQLENQGWRCWIAPRDINTTGLPYTEAIPRAIQQAKAVVMLLSPSANLSVHIPRELDLALAQHLPVVPLRLVELLPAGQLEYLLRTCQWLDVFGRDFGNAMGELVYRLRSLGL